MPDLRFAPPPALRVADRGGGLNQTSVRTYNERLVMSLLRQHDSLSRMELGRFSGLSAQTISVIVRALERDGLILAGKAQRGRVGPPSTPMALNPDGAFAVGVKVGVNVTDLVLIDFVGAQRHYLRHHYASPAPDAIIAQLVENLRTAIATLPAAKRDRIVGIGVALANDIEMWPQGGRIDGSNAWDVVGFEAALAAATGLPVYIQNDVTAAAGAELIFGAARTIGDFAYFFVGYESASRLVLNHHVYAGRRGATPAEGSTATGLVSLTDLDTALRDAGLEPDRIWLSPQGDWSNFGETLDSWVNSCGDSLADAIAFLCAFVDLNNVIVGGRLPASVARSLIDRVAAQLKDRLKLGSAAPSVALGDVGPFAKAIGAAGLVFHSRFMVEEVGLAADAPE
ncbi:ROK family transcriptional regulator [Bauldia sp.]|uniref:ROK family transcriptional regulator n=1 Tax=Bauldia sp. TaxID=2575872 RepID=UPI003BABF530